MADVFLLQFALYLWSNVVFGQSRKDVVYSIDVVFVLESSQTSSKVINLGIVRKNVFGGGEVGKWLGGGGRANEQMSPKKKSGIFPKI